VSHVDHPRHPLERHLADALAHHDWTDVTTLAAVSGGADSVAMLRGLCNLRKEHSGRLLVVHIHHHLREDEADRDAAFVSELAAACDLPCLVRHADGKALAARGDSLEAAAREARYALLDQVAAEEGARYVLTAHTADDQAETILHRILRGTGIDGLSGIRPVRPLSSLTTIIRPLLAVRRAEVLDYLATRGQAYCDDHTNGERRFTRNRLRHDLLPQLAADYNPTVVDALLRLGELAGEAGACLRQQSEELAARAVRSQRGAAEIDLGVLIGAPPYLVRQLFIHLWRERGWPQQAMSYDKWQALAALAASGEEGSLTLPGDIRAQKQGGRLTLFRPENSIG
jgi:tRNA(Ile)-lysidine synthase